MKISPAVLIPKVYDYGFMGRNLHGGMRFDYTQSKFECNTRCHQDPTCQGFDLNEDQKKCWFHKAATICQTPGSSCLKCIHFKNQRAACYVKYSTAVPSTTVTTTTLAPISSKFPVSLPNEKLSNEDTWVSDGQNLDACLRKCDVTSWCEAVDFNALLKVCILHHPQTACLGTNRNKVGWTIYRHRRITCGSTVFKDFTHVQLDYRRAQGVEHKRNVSVAMCLMQCKKAGTCTGINYKLAGLICEFQRAPNQCAPLTAVVGYRRYDLKSLLCAQDFRPVQFNKQAPTNIAKGKMSVNECLRKCMTSLTCPFINYQTSTSTCQHGTTNYRCQPLLPMNGWTHYKKTNYICPGDPTTARNCWTVMAAAATTCGKPIKPSTVKNLESLDGYCRAYNNYFSCVLTAQKAKNCPSIARSSLVAYVDTLDDLKSSTGLFCYIFSAELQNCLKIYVADIGRCETGAVKPNNVAIEAPASKCQELRDYLDCVQSVAYFRCKSQSKEFYQKSIKYTLLQRNNKCSSLSSPLVKSLSTHYGPAKGNSEIIIRGNNLIKFGPPTMVFKDVRLCYPSSLISNTSYVRCLTIPVTQVPSVTVGTVLQLRLFYSATNIYFTVGDFTYKGNPVVYNLYPTKSVIGGGTALTVNGTNLMYVVTPKYNVIRIDNIGLRKIYTTVCKVNPDDKSANDSKSLLCIVPAISVASTQTPAAGSEVKSVVFWNGLTLDGEIRYTDLSQAGLDASRGKKLAVYAPPKLEKSSSRIFEFKSFWPVVQKTFQIPGKYLDTAATSQDYKVFVGPTECKNLKITANMLMPEPPDRNPLKDGTSPLITVKAPGPTQNQKGVPVGVLHYQASIFDNPAGYYGLIFGGIFVLIIFIIIIVICCCCRKRK